MRALLGPPPALPRLQSKAPSRDQAPTGELGSWYLRLGSSLLCWGIWGVGEEGRGGPGRRSSFPPAACRTPCQSAITRDLGKS